MADHQQLRNSANQLRKAKRYNEAFQMYAKLWNNFREYCNEWDGWGYAFCLQKLKRYKEALEVCRDVFRTNPEFPNIKNVYAWSIYYTEIKKNKIENEPIFFKAAEAIVQLCRQEDKFSPYTLTVFKVIEYLKTKAIPNSDQILQWADKLDPVLLETEPFQFVDDTGKKRELASKREQYFMFRSTALFDKELWVECINCCEQALRLIPKFHYSNDIWFKRKIALSQRKVGETENALSLLKEILQTKKEWFIQSEIAEILFDKGEHDKALELAVDAALNFGDTDKKLNLFILLAEILKAKGEIDVARKHIAFIYKIRATNNWRIPQELLQQINSYQIDIQNITDLDEQQRELKRSWNQLKFKNKKQYSGKIKTILPNRNAGFIESVNGESYYFQIREFNGRRHEAREGVRVNFYLEDGFDRKKNRIVKNAVKVTVA